MSYYYTQSIFPEESMQDSLQKVILEEHESIDHENFLQMPAWDRRH
jgi:hypothetical protein